MDNELSLSVMQKLLGIGKVVLNELAKQGIAVRGAKRGTYRIEPVTRYGAHLREQAAGRGGEASQSARARLAEAQTALTETKARQLSGELVEAVEVEKLWTEKLRAFRAHLLTLPTRLRDLNSRQNSGYVPDRLRKPRTAFW